MHKYRAEFVLLFVHVEATLIVVYIVTEFSDEITDAVVPFWPKFVLFHSKRQLETSVLHTHVQFGLCKLYIFVSSVIEARLICFTKQKYLWFKPDAKPDEIKPLQIAFFRCRLQSKLKYLLRMARSSRSSGPPITRSDIALQTHRRVLGKQKF